MSENPNTDSIFCTAVEIESTDERDEYLERVCGDEPELRQQVQRLLDAHFEGGSILDSPPLGLGVTIDQPITEKPGTQIGPYQLLEQIGEGGMGVVYRAEQSKPVRRHVAIKIVKPGMDTKEVITRFEAERQVLAMMNHPGIAKVFDAGSTESGRPYFAMELVNGIPITKYCDQCNLPIRERLQLFIAVCDAVQHAHRKGIIHRDLKPSNVLISMQEGEAVPSIIDFGVAKAINQKLTQHTLVTAYAQMVGTPLYMSPEQAEMSPLEVDTRSDIYSLGVLQYELLTGTTPFERERMKSASFDELRQMIRHEEPPTPSCRINTLDDSLLSTIADRRRVEPRKLIQAVRTDLDWIVMKCLEKDRKRRYESANDLARDVERYLTDEPVEACPPSFGYRLSKFFRRNRVAVTATLAFLLTLAVATASVGWAVWDRAAQKIIIESEVDAALLKAEQLLDEGRPSDALAAAERASTISDRWSIDRSKQSSVRHWLRDVRLVLALEETRVSSDMHPTNRALDRLELLPRYREVLAQYGLKLDEDDTEKLIRSIRQRPPSVKRVILNSLSEIVELSRRQTSIGLRLEETEPRIIFIAPGGPAATSGLKVGDLIVAIDGENSGSLHDVSTSDEALKSIAGEKGSSLLIRARRNQSEPSQAFVVKRGIGWRDVLAIINRVDDDPWRKDFWDAAEREDRDLMFALTSDQDLLAQPPISICMLASQLETPTAIDTLRRAYQHYPNSFLIISALADRIKQLDAPARNEAVEFYRVALSMRPNSPGVRFNFGTALTDARRHEEAVDQLRRVLEVIPDHSSAHNNLAISLTNLGYFDDAFEHYQRAISLKPENYLYHLNVGILWDQQLELAAAIKSYRRAIELSPSNLDDLANLYRWVGDDSRDTGHPEEGIIAFREALKYKPDWTLAIEGIGKCQICLGEPAAAIETFRKASQIGNTPASQFRILSFADLLDEDSDPAAKFYVKVLESTKEDWSGIWVFLPQDQQLFDRIVELMPDDPRPWHARARAHEATEQWELSAGDWARVIELTDRTAKWNSPGIVFCQKLAARPKVFRLVTELKSNDELVWLGAAQVHAYQCQWEDASTYYAKAPSFADFERAGVFLLSGNRLAYQQLRDSLLPDSSEPIQPSDKWYVYNLIRMCCLDPIQVVDSQKLVAWAEQILELPLKARAFHTAGLAYYRAGEFDLAIEMLNASLDEEWQKHVQGLNWLVLAMVHHRLQHQKEADSMYRKAKQLIQEAARRERPRHITTEDWIELHVLLRETELLLKRPAESLAYQHAEGRAGLAF